MNCPITNLCISTCTHVHVYTMYIYSVHVYHNMLCWKGIITMCVWIPLIVNGFIQLAHVFVCCLFCQSEPLLSCWGVLRLHLYMYTYTYNVYTTILALFPGSPPCELLNDQKLGRIPGRFCMSASVWFEFHLKDHTCIYTFNN